MLGRGRGACSRKDIVAGAFGILLGLITGAMVTIFDCCFFNISKERVPANHSSANVFESSMINDHAQLSSTHKRRTAH